jgi:hypothetical protein
MINDIKNIEIALRKSQEALLVDSENQWDEIINGKSELNNNSDSPNRIYIRVCGQIVIDKHSKTSERIEYLVTTYMITLILK